MRCDCAWCVAWLASRHQRRGMGAEDYCTCDRPWPCLDAASSPTATTTDEPASRPADAKGQEPA